MKALRIQIWCNIDWPARHGYTPATEDELAMLRLGPIVLGWEVTED